MRLTIDQVRQQLDWRQFAQSAMIVLAVTACGTCLSTRSRTSSRETSSASAREPQVAEHPLIGLSSRGKRQEPPSTIRPKTARPRSQTTDSNNDARPHASSPLRLVRTDTANTTHTAATITEATPRVQPATSDAARTIVERHLAPFGLEQSGASVYHTCVAARGIWSQRGVPSCQLPGGRLFRFAVTSDSVRSIILEQVGNAPVPLFQRATVDTLNALSSATHRGLIISASETRLSVVVAAFGTSSAPHAY